MDYQELVRERKEILKGLPLPEFVEFIIHHRIGAPCSDYRDDVTVHELLCLPCDTITDAVRESARRWVEERRFQWSRQLVGNPADPDMENEHIYIGNILPVEIEIGYHATLVSSWPSIRRTGLEPSKPDRQTSKDRLDCEGNIYVCKDLGYPQDVGKVGTFSAHWWRHELAKENRSDVRDWVILEVNLRGLSGAQAMRDIWSESGVIITGVDRIPADRVRLVYP